METGTSGIQTPGLHSEADQKMFGNEYQWFKNFYVRVVNNFFVITFPTFQAPSESNYIH